MALQTVGWLQNAGAVHTASQLRLYMGMLQAANFSTATSLRARGGVHPSLGSQLSVGQAGSPNMTVLVQSGLASIPGTESSTQGNYFVINDAQVTLNVTAAHGSLARIDIVVVNVRDAFYSGVNNDAQLQVVAGTPASSPVAPAAPANAIILAQIAVGAGVTSIVDANITDTRFYVAAAGGVINARNDAARPVSAEMVQGQWVWTNDNNRMYLWNGTDYAQVYPGYNKLAETILSGAAATVTFSSIPSTYTSLRLVISARGDNATAFVSARLRFNADATSIYDSQQVLGNAASALAGEGINTAFIEIGEIGAASAAAGAAGAMNITVPHHIGTSHWKHTISNHVLSNGTGTGTLHSKQWVGRWRNTAAVTSITLLVSAGNFASGSRFSLYGLP